ncbi:TPA: nucleotidyltransferase, partial [Streptococcus pneumoniae]
MITYRNDLLSKELDILISFFKKCEVGKISLVITGSLARGNPRIKDGKLESDIDILVIVDSIQQLISIKKTLEGRFHFVHKISLIFCLKERINRSRYR